MEFKTLEVSVQGKVARVLLNRPEAGNSINVTMISDLRKVMRVLEDKTDVEVIFLGARGPDFCKGIDLSDFAPDDVPDIHGFNRWEKVCRSLERIPALTIAVTHGECAGGGLQLALACDIRVGAEDARYHFHDVRMGFIPGMGTFRLAKFIGLGRARRMALTGRKVNGIEAERIGLIDHVAAPDQLWEKAEEALAEFGHLNVNTVELIRRLMDESFEFSWEDFLGHFLAAQDRAIRMEEFRNFIRRAHEKGTPRGEDD
jgi:enoyl-CoA hydratase/carnithine racemase